MFHKNLSIASIFLVLLCIPLQSTDAINIRNIAETLRDNIIGSPVVHARSNWDFDPEAARKSKAIFIETHGFRAEKFIERIGVGTDGKQEERRAQHKIRDYGRLNGEHMINFPGPQ